MIGPSQFARASGSPIVIFSVFWTSRRTSSSWTAALDVDAAVRGALLAPEAEGAPDDPVGRLLEVRLGRDDRRVLAAHLHDARLGPPLREGPEQGHPDLVRAGEDDAVDTRALLDLLPDALAGSHHEVEDAVGQAGVAIGLGQEDAAHRARRRGLEDDGVARHQGARAGAGRESHREVEGADDREDAERAQDGARADRGVAEVVHRVDVPVVAFVDVRVVADEVGGLLHLAQGLEPALADLDGHQGCVLHLALGDEVRGPAEDREALAAMAPRATPAARPEPRPPRPSRPGAFPGRTSRRGSRGRSASGARTSPRRHDPRRRSSSGGGRPGGRAPSRSRRRRARGALRCRCAGSRR